MTTRRLRFPTWAEVLFWCVVGYPVIFAVSYLFLVALLD